MSTELNDEKCDKCLEKAKEVKATLTQLVIAQYEVRSTEKCLKIIDEAERNDCLELVETAVAQLQFLLRHNETEFCIWIEECPETDTKSTLEKIVLG